MTDAEKIAQLEARVRDLKLAFEMAIEALQESKEHIRNLRRYDAQRRHEPAQV